MGIRARALSVGLALVAASAIFLPGASAAEGPGVTAAERKGLVMRDLVKADRGPCAAVGYEIRSATGNVSCTHGPDPAPSGVDVTQPRSLEELRSETFGSETATHGHTTVPCIEDGTSGNRVQAIYAYAIGNDNSATIVPLIKEWAVQNIDFIVSSSASDEGGMRSVRFVTTESNGACEVDVLAVPLATTALGSLGDTEAALAALGLDRSDRKYLVWADATVYCGIAAMYPDDSPGFDNANNGAGWAPGMVARIDRGCWGNSAGTPVEAHELMHTLGAVQDSSPNGTGHGHCSDDYDVMCYDDGPTTVMTIECTDPNAERRLDCNKNDYFSTAPAAGTYLATHWNTANSSFLAGSEAACTRSGTAGNDVLEGTSARDVLCGLEGNDSFVGLGGNDVFYGGLGTDTADYSSASARIEANMSASGVTGVATGSDLLASIERVVGTAYDDDILGGAGREQLIGGGGNDTLLGYGENDKLAGGPGADELDGGAGNDTFVGGTGTDHLTLAGSAAGVTVDLAKGTATGFGTDKVSGIEAVTGTRFDDRISGTDRANYVMGWLGTDVVLGRGGKDELHGSDGNDKVYGGAGNDWLTGGAGNEVLYGQAGSDAFDGGEGTDKCSGGADGYYYMNACES